MATKHRTKADNAWLEKITALGCIACLVQGTPGTPGEVHHLRVGQGRGQRADHEEHGARVEAQRGAHGLDSTGAGPGRYTGLMARLQKKPTTSKAAMMNSVTS